ncbi:MAG TPA: class I tRNA ligase family protein, partial [Candidatus Paceibacterota bacterium]|nr:class I tRNA ligase family protein [Candidatus Paceibacterota bacterium]
GTTLSNFEVNQGYKDIKDIAVTVKLRLLDDIGEPTDTFLLVWTTTPWTLPGNLAAAVHNEHTYVRVTVATEAGAEEVILAKERLAQLGTEEYNVLEEMPGSDLVGRRYVPPFPWLQAQDMDGKDNAWKIYHADYVELGEEGTGAVHLAPAYGEEDMDLAKAEGVPIIHHVDETGHFKDFVTDFAGQLVKPKDDEASEVSHLDADIMVVKALKANGTLFRKENITHSYPHCWRCDTPLLNYATTSWFVEVTKFKDELVAENNKITWVPEHVGTNRFGKWLEGARDWAVSRQRYWGAPLPVWRNPETGEIKVFGSLEELQQYVPKSGNTYYTLRHGESTKNVEPKIVTDDPDADYPLTEQ